MEVILNAFPAGFETEPLKNKVVEVSHGFLSNLQKVSGRPLAARDMAGESTLNERIRAVLMSPQPRHIEES